MYGAVELKAITIWTSEYENRDAVTHIGRVYKEKLGLPPKIVIGYQSPAVVPPLKIGFLLKKTPSEYSHRKLLHTIEIRG